MIANKVNVNDLHLSSYHYDLPEHLIAQHPLPERDSARMMILDRGRKPRHGHIREVLEYLKPGDCLVLNNTRVIPARLYGSTPEGGAVELLLLKRKGEFTWEVIGKPGRKLKVGRRIIFLPGKLEAVVDRFLPDGGRLVRFEFTGIWEERLDEAGTMPLPPYIHEKLADPERYQTVYAKAEGSAAAPTAGLHFTRELLAEIRGRGIEIAEVTLHVGLGTFRPVHEDYVLDHQMHTEMYEVTETCAEVVNRCKLNGGSIVCVGTTSCRTLESAVNKTSGLLEAGRGDTNLFIYPGFRFTLMDKLLTNFHLPESTLLMLVSAFYGRERMLEAYREAVREEYRFFSFGDCMLIIPEGAAYV